MLMNTQLMKYRIVTPVTNNKRVQVCTDTRYIQRHGASNDGMSLGERS